MRRILQITIMLSTICVLQANAQIATGYEVGKWYQFKTAAVSYTLDDFCSKQYPVALPLFDKYGFKVTFNVVSGWSPNWTNLKTAAANGHEVACHTTNHTSLNTETVTQQDAAMKDCQTIINTNISNKKCLTIAYPNCNIGDKTTIAKYFIAGRICSGQIESSTPSDFYNISSLICGSQGSISTATNFNNSVNSAKTSKGWCVFLIHGIDDDGGYSPTSSSELSSHLSSMNTNIADFWIGTFLNVAQYIKERNAAAITETTITSDSLKMVLTDGLDNALYFADLTVRRTIPTAWAGAKVYLGTTALASTTTTVNGTKYVMFNIAPDAGNVYIVNTASASTTASPTVTSSVNYCQGTTATALTATGTSLKWYTVATGGTGSSTAPTPSTASVGTTSYYVSQTLNNIESSRAKIDVVVSAVPAAPTVTATITYTKNATATALSATGTNLKWYSAASGGTSTTLAPTPSTSFAGTTKFYVSQSANGCESSRSEISVTVNAPVVKIPLTAGWNWVGCPLDGATPIEKAMASIWSNVLSVKDLQSFYLSTNPADFNLLKSVIWGEGYMVKVSKDCELIWTAN